MTSACTAVKDTSEKPRSVGKFWTSWTASLESSFVPSASRNQHAVSKHHQINGSSFQNPPMISPRCPPSPLRTSIKYPVPQTPPTFCVKIYHPRPSHEESSSPELCTMTPQKNDIRTLDDKRRKSLSRIPSFSALEWVAHPCTPTEAYSRAVGGEGAVGHNLGV